MSQTEITVRYRSIDHFSKTAKFKTLEGAQKFAHRYVGKHPEISYNFFYAVSGDGVGKITCEGASIFDLFPEEKSLPADFDPEYDRY